MLTSAPRTGGPFKKFAGLNSKVINISQSAEDELISRGRFKLDPGLATHQALGQFVVMNKPASLQEVKIFRRLRTRVENFWWDGK
jgi:hypothetical protein